MTLSKAAQAERAKRLAPEEVARMDQGRALAEKQQGRRGPGRPRKDGSPAQPRAKSVSEAVARVRNEGKPAEKTVAKPAPEWRQPTQGEIEQIKFFMRMGNKPLVQLERDLEEAGNGIGMPIVGPESPPALVKKGEIPASEEELDMGAQCTAGTLITFCPSILPYLAPIGLAFFTVGFIGSRVLIFLRIRRAFDLMEKAQKAEEERRAGLKTVNGAQVTGSPAPTPSVN